MTIVSDDEDNSEFLVNFKGTAVEDIRPEVSVNGANFNLIIYGTNFETISGSAVANSGKGIQVVKIYLGNLSYNTIGSENWEFELPEEYRPTEGNDKYISLKAFDMENNKSEMITVCLKYWDSPIIPK